MCSAGQDELLHCTSAHSGNKWTPDKSIVHKEEGHEQPVESADTTCTRCDVRCIHSSTKCVACQFWPLVLKQAEVPALIWAISSNICAAGASQPAWLSTRAVVVMSFQGACFSMQRCQQLLRSRHHALCRSTMHLQFASSHEEKCSGHVSLNVVRSGSCGSCHAESTWTKLCVQPTTYRMLAAHAGLLVQQTY